MTRLSKHLSASLLFSGRYGLALAIYLSTVPALIPASDAVERGKALAVIVHKSSDIENLSFSEVRKYFLLQRHRWPDGRKVTIVLPAEGLPSRSVALRDIYQMTEQAFKRHFLQEVFTGKSLSSPKSLSSAESVQKFVNYVPGAIGCVGAQDVTDLVKVIRVDGYLPNEPRYGLGRGLDE